MVGYVGGSGQQQQQQQQQHSNIPEYVDRTTRFTARQYSARLYGRLLLLVVSCSIRPVRIFPMMNDFFPFPIVSLMGFQFRAVSI